MSFINKIKIDDVSYDVQDTEARRLIEELKQDDDPNEIIVDGFLRNLGHFEDADNLPDTGQASGEVGEHPSTLDIDYTKTDITIPTLPNLTTFNGKNAPYVFGFYVDRENYFFVSTDNPELIDGFSYSLDGSYHIYTNSGESMEKNFVVPHACYNGLFMEMLPTTELDGCALVLPKEYLPYFLAGDFTAATGHPPLMGIYQPSILMHYLGSEKPVKIFGNLPTKVKYREHLQYAFKKITWDAPVEIGYELISEEAERDSLTLAFANNYTYTDGMEALRFDENYNAYWITGEDGAKENDVAIVGENNEIHVVNNYGEWEQWNKHETTSTNEFLCNKGHFNDEESLPSEGQPSGTLGSSPRTFSSDPTLNTSVEIPVNTAYSYLFGAINSSTTYLYVATNFPEVIKSMAYGSDGSYEIYFEASPSKPVAVYYTRSSYSGAYLIPDSQKDDYYVVRNNQPSNGTNITEPSTLTGYLGGYGQARIFGNLPNIIQYKEHGYYAYARNTSGNSGYTYTDISSANSDSLTLAFADNYTYNAGMQMLRFDDNYQAYWILADSQVQANDFATIGEYNDIYIVNSSGKWEKCNKSDSYTKAEIDTMLGEIDNVLDNILNGG